MKLKEYSTDATTYVMVQTFYNHIEETPTTNIDELMEKFELMNEINSFLIPIRG